MLDQILPPKPGPVVKPGDFKFAAAYFDHGHVYTQAQGLVEAGGVLKWIFDPQPKQLGAFRAQFPTAKIARSFDEILDDPEIQLVTTASVPCERGPIGLQVFAAGKHYFTDKPPVTTWSQLEDIKSAVAKHRRIFAAFFSERLHSECAIHAGTLIQRGAIGRVYQVIGLGPHRLSKPNRPAWFFDKQKYGGILCDIGSHQCEQFLHYTGATDAEVTHAAVANHQNKDCPAFEDFGEASFLGNNGATHYMRVDWFTPAGLGTWGDGRTIILGSEGYIELRKYTDVAATNTPDHLILVDAKGEHHMELKGKIGFSYYGELILDCLQGTESAMPQAHVFKSVELCLKAQAAARRIP